VGEAMETMAATFAQVERRRIGERTREALAIRRQQGIKLGRPASILPELADRIGRMRADGLTLQAIADRLNESRCRRRAVERCGARHRSVRCSSRGRRLKARPRPQREAAPTSSQPSATSGRASFSPHYASVALATTGGRLVTPFLRAATR